MITLVDFSFEGWLGRKEGREILYQLCLNHYASFTCITLLIIGTKDDTSVEEHRHITLTML